MSIKRYDIEVATRYAFINECESEKGYYVRSEDHAAEVARLNEQLDELKSRLQLVSELSDAAAALHVEAEKQVQALAAEREEAINRHRNHAARLIAERGQLRQRLEAAEAQIKELTADLDKESEIRHRIHEELNAIKDEQQPIYQVEVLEGWVDYSKPKFDKMIVGEFPCTGKRVLFIHPAPAVLPPEPKETDCPEWIADPFSWACGAGWMRDAAIALGAKPLPVIDPDTLTKIMQNAWNEWCDDTGHFPDDFELRGKAIYYDACRWSRLVAERIIRAAGLEVKS